MPVANSVAGRDAVSWAGVGRHRSAEVEEDDRYAQDDTGGLRAVHRCPKDLVADADSELVAGPVVGTSGC